MSSGISSRRMASICYCGDPYQTESVPHMMWSAPIPLINVPINAAENLGWATAELANDVPSSAYTLVTPNLCGISARSLAHLDATGRFEFRPGPIRQLEERAQRGMIHNEIHLRPVLGGLADIPDSRVFPDACERFLVIGRQQALVDAYRRNARVHRLFIERIHHLLV